MTDTDKNYPRMTPEMRAKSFRRFQRMLYGDLIKDAATAIALAEVLVKNNFGDDVLKKQRPLKATADGDFWIVEGSVTKDPAKQPEGPVILRINKADLTVDEFYLHLNRPTDPAATDKLRKRK
jgi:hypothetical protein